MNSVTVCLQSNAVLLHSLLLITATSFVIARKLTGEGPAILNLYVQMVHILTIFIHVHLLIS